jgi:hypothetical protein
MYDYLQSTTMMLFHVAFYCKSGYGSDQSTRFGFIEKGGGEIIKCVSI